MRRPITCLTLLALVLCVVSSAQAAPTIAVDPGTANTIIFRDYNGTSDTNISYGGTAPTQAVGNGVSEWTYGAVHGDPTMTYNDGAGTYDFATFPWMRMRYKQSRSNSGTPQAWENPAQGGEHVQFSTSTAFIEGHGDPNSAGSVNPPFVPHGSGYRIDPFQPSAIGDVFTADYVMIDRYETIGLGEWDADGDFNGWSPNARISGPSVANSLFSGTGAGTGDAYMTNSINFDADKYKFLEIRVRSDTLSQVFWATNGAFVGSQFINFGGSDDAFHTYLLDFRDESTWAGSNMRIRFDPVTSVGATFDLDYIRLRTLAVVPEPSTVAMLLGLGVVGLVGYLRRRRKS